MERWGYNYGEIYYIGLLHHVSRRPVVEIVRYRSNGLGWGEVAHRLGVHPSTLNKARVAVVKKSKPQERVIIVEEKGKHKGKGRHNK